MKKKLQRLKRYDSQSGVWERGQEDHAKGFSLLGRSQEEVQGDVGKQARKPQRHSSLRLRIIITYSSPCVVVGCYLVLTTCTLFVFQFFITVSFLVSS